MSAIKTAAGPQIMQQHCVRNTFAQQAILFGIVLLKADDINIA